MILCLNDGVAAMKRKTETPEEAAAAFIVEMCEAIDSLNRRVAALEMQRSASIPNRVIALERQIGSARRAKAAVTEWLTRRPLN
jgi:hypothetical protein